MLDADANIALVALAISLISFGATLLQVLQQYLSTASDYRHCSQQCLGGWSVRTRRRFILRELRFEVQYSVPHISLYWPFTEQIDLMENSKTLDQPVYCLSRSSSSDASDRLIFVHRGLGRKSKPWKRVGGKRVSVALREDQLWFVRGEQAHPQAKCSWLSLLEECTLTNLAFHITEVRHSRDYDFEGAIRHIDRPMAKADLRVFLALMSLFRTKWSPDTRGTFQGTGPDFHISTIEVPSIGTVYKYSKLHFIDDKEMDKKLVHQISQEPVSIFSLLIDYFRVIMEGIIQVGVIDAIAELHKGFQWELPDPNYTGDSPEPNASDATSNNTSPSNDPGSPSNASTPKQRTSKSKLKEGKTLLPPRPRLYLVRAHWSPRDCPKLRFVEPVPEDQLTLIRVMFNHFELPFMTLRTSSPEEVKQSILGVFTNPDLAEAVSKRKDDGCYPGIGELVACWGFPSMPRVVNEVSDSFMTIFSASPLGCPLGIPQIGHAFIGKGAWTTVAPSAQWREVLDLIRQFWYEFDQIFSSQGSGLSRLVELYSDSRKYIEICVSLDLSQDWDENTNILYSTSLKHSTSLELPRILYLLDYYFESKIVAHGHDPSPIMSEYMLDIAVNRANHRLGRSVTNSEQAMDTAEDTISLVNKLSGHCNPQGQQVYDKKQAELIVINRLVRGIIWILHNGNAPGKNSKNATAASASGASEDRSLECSLSSSVLDESAGATICLA